MGHPLISSSIPPSATPYTGPNLCCRLGEGDGAVRPQRRRQVLEQQGFASGRLSPALQDGVQAVAQFLRTPLALFSLVDDTTEHIQAAHGLSQVGLTSPLALDHALSQDNSFAFAVVDSGQPLVLADVHVFPSLAASDLVQHHGVRAYAGVPLVAAGVCVGVLAVLDTAARSFTQQDMVFMEMTARWLMAEQDRLASAPVPLPAQGAAADPDAAPPLNRGLDSLIDAVKLHLISQLTQDLRSPLTSVMGMASMLNRQIYGPLTSKQQEYTDIIRSSSQTLMTLVDEIVELGSFDHTCQALVPNPVDIQMLGLQIVSAFEQIAERRHQTLQLTVEPGERIWVLDRGKVKQILYHLLFSISQMAGENTSIRLHASRKAERLHLAVWLSNPWLGEGLPPAALRIAHLLTPQYQPVAADLFEPGAEDFSQAVVATGYEVQPGRVQRDALGLLLSQQIANLHQGSITVQGNPDAGYRFVVDLPSLGMEQVPTPATQPVAESRA